MKTCNDATSIIQNIRLLHIKWHLRDVIFRSKILVLLLLESLDCNDYSDYWLRQKGQKVLVESKDLTYCPLFAHADLVHVLSENVRVALQWRPVESCFLHYNQKTKILL